MKYVGYIAIFACFCVVATVEAAPKKQNPCGAVKAMKKDMHDTYRVARSSFLRLRRKVRMLRNLGRLYKRLCTTKPASLGKMCKGMRVRGTSMKQTVLSLQEKTKALLLKAKLHSGKYKSLCQKQKACCKAKPKPQKTAEATKEPAAKAAPAPEPSVAPSAAPGRSAGGLGRYGSRTRSANIPGMPGMSAIERMLKKTDGLKTKAGFEINF